jgi:hypothetical protein
MDTLASPCLPRLPGGRYSINCSEPQRARDCRLLDTNGDGQLDMSDDMFEPYYPGDDVVDWVGMEVLHLGQVGHGCCWRRVLHAWATAALQ